MYIYIHTHTYIGASLIAELKTFWSGRSTGEGANPTPVFLDLPGGSTGKEPACNAGDLGLIPGWEDPLEKGTATHSSILAWRIPWTV